MSMRMTILIIVMMAMMRLMMITYHNEFGDNDDDDGVGDGYGIYSGMMLVMKNPMITLSH